MGALSAYDQQCEDEPGLNRLQECLVLFNHIANHKLFTLTSMILFLNKIDIFQRKLESGSLVSKYFPEYRGPNDYFSTTVFFQYRFLQQVKDLTKQVYTHFTHATVSFFSPLRVFFCLLFVISVCRTTSKFNVLAERYLKRTPVFFNGCLYF